MKIYVLFKKEVKLIKNISEINSDQEINCQWKKPIYFFMYSSLALWKHHVNLLLQSFRSVN